MARCEYRVGVKVAWWVMPYLFLLGVFARMVGREPDRDKAVALIIKRGVTLVMVPNAQGAKDPQA